MMEAEKPFFVFEMTDSSPKDAERFRQVSDETLCEMQERGIDPSVVETALKARAIHDYTAGEDTDVFADSIVPEVSLKWALTGDADVYADEAAAYDSLDAGTAQAEIRRFAAELGAAKRRVLVTTIPTPGDGRGDGAGARRVSGADEGGDERGRAGCADCEDPGF